MSKSKKIVNIFSKFKKYQNNMFLSEWFHEISRAVFNVNFDLSKIPAAPSYSPYFQIVVQLRLTQTLIRSQTEEARVESK